MVLLPGHGGTAPVGLPAAGREACGACMGNRGGRHGLLHLI